MTGIRASVPELPWQGERQRNECEQCGLRSHRLARIELPNRMDRPARKVWVCRDCKDGRPAGLR